MGLSFNSCFRYFILVAGLLIISCSPPGTLLNKQMNLSDSFSVLVQKNKQPPSAPQKSIRPILDCIRINQNKTHIAYFSYFNESSTPVEIPIGPNNYFHHTNQNQGQPILFAPGQSNRYPQSVFQVTFEKNNLVWSLNGTTITATKNSPVCTEPPPSNIVFDPVPPQQLSSAFPDRPGNQNIPDPETSDVSIFMNGLSANPVATGQAVIKLAKPISENLQRLQTEYGVRVLHGPDSDGSYLIMPDMTRIDVNKLTPNLEVINQNHPKREMVVNKVSLANLEAARTLTFITELMLKNFITSVSFNPMLTPNADGLVTQENNIPLTGAAPGSYNAENSYWLNDHTTKINRAWNYSNGYDIEHDRPIRVAVIDSGFAGLNYHMLPGNDLDGQILLDEGWLLKYDEITKTIRIGQWTSDRLAETYHIPNQSILASHHGTFVSSIIAAHHHNKVGIAGVAPGARIIPIQVHPTHFYAVKIAIELAISAQADVINLSLGGSAPDPFLQDWTTYTKNNTWYSGMQSTLRAANQAGVIVIAAAGNGSWDINRALFAGRETSQEGVLIFPEVITVGALTDLDALTVNPPNDIERAVWRHETDNLTINSIREFGSNYGKIDIWAPGTSIVALGRSDLDFINGGIPYFGTQNASPIYYFSGTSVAAPIISGMAALMKSRVNSLNHTPNTSGDILGFLGSDNNTFRRSYTDTKLRTPPSEDTSGTFTCIESLPHIKCGDLTSKTTTIRLPDMSRVITSLTQDQAQNHSGYLIKSGSHVYFTENGTQKFLFKLNGTSNYEQLKNFWSTNAQSIGVIIEYSIPINVLGWIRGNTLHSINITDSNPSCLTQTIVTNTSWKWTDNSGVQRNAVINPQYLNEIDIPSIPGAEVLPIWSELNQNGTAVCGNCLYNFYSRDYFLPPGNIVAVRLDIQADDEATVFVNQQPIGPPATYAETFGRNDYKTYDITPFFRSGMNNTMHFVFQVRGFNGAIQPGFEDFNHAAFAAKITLRHCPNAP
ncbi:MAG: S8/S53 family peptidase [Candidatus Sericytochromatia bacterium]|nr:S8/S53 family peptidase [Candidatus Sericytochromatia bacterium]